MKIIDNFKKFIVSCGTAILSLPNKIFGVEQELYGPPPTIGIGTMYGVEPVHDNTINNIVKFFIIPLAFIIGIIIYFKKSKSKVLKKVFVAISVLIALILLGILVERLL